MQMFHFFSVLEDGTKDKNRRENIAIATRYVKDGEIYESMLSIETTTALDAETYKHNFRYVPKVRFKS